MTRYSIMTIMATWVLLGLAGAGCVKRYEPEVVAAANRYLVVDGHINGHGITVVQLAYSINLDTPNQYPVEEGAQVFIVDERNARYALRETTPGRYESAFLTLPANRSYYLRITTRQRREYASEPVFVQQTPAYDNLVAQVQPDGVQVLLSTHDNENKIQYYRWEYDETWEFTSAFDSKYRYSRALNRVVPRQDDIYHCWRTETASTVKTFSTIRLTEARVRDYRLRFLRSNDIRLRYLYSINVRQYAMLPEEFNYWEAVRKNTDNLGTLFDPLPSQIQGNVHSLNKPEEPVLGYVGASTVTEQRIFVRRQDLPVEWRLFPDSNYKHCVDLDTFPSRRYLAFTLYDFYGDSTYRTPVGALRPGSAFTASTLDCIDCRLHGTTVRPTFWPQ